MIGVQVADQDQGDAPHPEPAQAGVDQAGIGAGVDQHRPPRFARRQHQGVTLAHVAGDHRPPGRRPPRRQDPGRHQHHRQPEHGRGEQRPPPPRPGEQQQDQDHRGQQQAAAHPVRPRQHGSRYGGGPVGDQHQPAHRRTGDPRRQFRRRPAGGQRQQRPQRGEHCGEHPEDRGRRHRGHGQQVRQHGHRVDRAVEPGHQRRGGQERGGRHRERLGGPTGHPTPVGGLGPGRGEQHQGPGGHHGQREPRVDRQCRIGQQQHQHRRRERRQRRPPPARREREQHDPAHHRGPQHARGRPREHHEPDHRPGTEHRGQPRIGPEQARQRQHRPTDDRQVRPGHREQVRQPGRGEVVLDLGGEQGAVADRQSGQQPGRARREHRGGRAAEPGPQAARGVLPPRRPGRVTRRAADPQHRHQQV